MNRELVLAGSAAVVVVVAAGLAALSPGVVAEGDPLEVERPSRLDVAEMSIASGTVGGAAVDLRVETRLVHAGGPAENVSLLVRAYDTDSGLLTTSTRVPVGTVETDGERPVETTLSVPREGTYRIEAVVFEGDRRVQTVTREVSGLDTLQPGYERTNLTFRQFEQGAIPPVEFSVRNASGGRASLTVSSYLTNAGGGSVEDVELVVKARQADSNIVADTSRVDVGPVEPGRTATPEVELVVPSEYNYYLDAFLVRDGVVVDTARAAANLNPTERVSVNETVTETGLEVSDFERDDGGRARTEEPTTTQQAGPGFTVVVAVGALLASALLARRWSR